MLAGLYAPDGKYLGKPKTLPLDLNGYQIVGRVVKGPRWFRPWRVERWMTQRELAKHIASFAALKGAP
jgi:hypothetical protein